MREDRRGVTERAIQPDLLGRVRDVVVAADHVTDPHLDVVAHDGEVVDGGAVTPEDDEVVEVASLETDPAVDRVLPGDLVVLQQETDREGCRGAYSVIHLLG